MHLWRRWKQGVQDRLALTLAFALLPQHVYDNAAGPIKDGWLIEKPLELEENWELLISEGGAWFVFAPPQGVSSVGAQMIVDEAIDRGNDSLGTGVRTFTLPWPKDRGQLKGHRLPNAFSKPAT